MSVTSGNPPRLLDQVHEVIRIRHYSIRTEQAYVQWIRRFILFHGKRHPREMGASELSAFLSDLAMQHNVAASTQNQALHAILFLYRDVLKIDLPWLDEVQRAKKPQRLPVVFTRDEVKARYKTLVKRHHPDANGGNRDAEERLKVINRAYSVLRANTEF